MTDWKGKTPKGLALMGLGGVATALLMTSGTPAEARRTACADRADVVARLADGYGESRQAMGLGANNGVVEVFASTETGTWTITVTMPNGMTCLVASGQAFEAVAEEILPSDDNDA